MSGDLGPRILSVNWLETAIDGESKRTFVELGELLGDDWAGVAPSQQDRGAHGGRLGWVYYYSGSEDKKKRERREERMFNQDDLVDASRFFCCHRLDVDRLPKDHALRKRITKLPAFEIEAVDGATTDSFAGALSSRLLFKHLSDAFRAHYGEDLGKRVRRHLKVRREIEQLEAVTLDLRAFVRDLGYALEDRDSHADARELARAKKNLAKAEEKLQKLREERRKLESLPVVAKTG